jgi:hypothetical protein
LSDDSFGGLPPDQAAAGLEISLFTADRAGLYTNTAGDDSEKKSVPA